MPLLYSLYHLGTIVRAVSGIRAVVLLEGPGFLSPLPTGQCSAVGLNKGLPGFVWHLKGRNLPVEGSYCAMFSASTCCSKVNLLPEKIAGYLWCSTNANGCYSNRNWRKGGRISSQPVTSSLYDPLCVVSSRGIRLKDQCRFLHCILAGAQN